MLKYIPNQKTVLVIGVIICLLLAIVLCTDAKANELPKVEYIAKEKPMDYVDTQRVLIHGCYWMVFILKNNEGVAAEHDPTCVNVEHYR